MVTTIKDSTHLSSHRVTCVCVRERTLKSYSPRKFQVYNTVLLTIFLGFATIFNSNRIRLVSIPSINYQDVETDLDKPIH